MGREGRGRVVMEVGEGEVGEGVYEVEARWGGGGGGAHPPPLYLPCMLGGVWRGEGRRRRGPYWDWRGWQQGHFRNMCVEERERGGRLKATVF